MLHIHNGESSAGTLKQSSVPGEIFSFQDTLIGGPTPAGLRGEDWPRVRAHHLSESYGVDLAKCERMLLNLEQTLASSSDHDDTVLSSAHDVLCQVKLIYLLDWF